MLGLLGKWGDTLLLPVVRITVVRDSWRIAVGKCGTSAAAENWAQVKVQLR